MRHAKKRRHCRIIPAHLLNVIVIGLDGLIGINNILNGVKRQRRDIRVSGEVGMAPAQRKQVGADLSESDQPQHNKTQQKVPDAP